MREIDKLKKENKLTDEDIKNHTIEESTYNFEKFTEDFSKKYDVDPSKFHVHSHDFMRVEVGVVIARPPIFLSMENEDWKFMVNRHMFMKEYYCDQA